MALSNILQGAFDTATGITNTVVGGQNYRKELDVNKDVTVTRRAKIPKQHVLSSLRDVRLLP